MGHYDDIREISERLAEEKEAIRMPVLPKEKVEKIQEDKLERKHEVHSSFFAGNEMVPLPEFLDKEGINHPQPVVPNGDVIDEIIDVPKQDPKMPEMVNHPAHYNQGKIECIDAIESALSREEFIGFLRGNMLKYTWRMRSKNGHEDKKKSDWYSNRLEKVLTEGMK